MARSSVNYLFHRSERAHKVMEDHFSPYYKGTVTKQLWSREVRARRPDRKSCAMLKCVTFPFPPLITFLFPVSQASWRMSRFESEENDSKDGSLMRCSFR